MMSLPGMNFGLEDGGSPGDLCNLAQDSGICGSYWLDSKLCEQEVGPMEGW